MLLLWKTPRLWVTCLQSTESCSVSDNFMCWWRFFQVALLPYHGRISSKVLCKFQVSTLLFLLEIDWNLFSRYFTVFVFCNWSLLCLSFIDWFISIVLWLDRERIHKFLSSSQHRVRGEKDLQHRLAMHMVRCSENHVVFLLARRTQSAAVCRLLNHECFTKIAQTDWTVPSLVCALPDTILKYFYF